MGGNRDWMNTEGLEDATPSLGPWVISGLVPAGSSCQALVSACIGLLSFAPPQCSVPGHGAVKLPSSWGSALQWVFCGPTVSSIPQRSEATGAGCTQLVTRHAEYRWFPCAPAFLHVFFFFMFRWDSPRRDILGTAKCYGNEKFHRFT